MTGPRTDLGEAFEVFAVAAHDERPALEVLAAAGAAARVEDPVEVGRLERPVREPPDGAARQDSGPDRVLRRFGHEPVAGAVWAGPSGSGSGRGGRVAPGSATWASVRNPPTVAVTASNWASPSGIRVASAISARSPATSGSNGPPSARLRKLATVRRYPASSYNQECNPPSTTSVSTSAATR